MPSAATTSPFAAQDMTASPWIVWARKDAVSLLEEQKQTDGRFVFENPDDAYIPRTVPSGATPQTEPIQTMRYHAVLSKMDQAKKRAAAFSAWSS